MIARAQSAGVAHIVIPAVERSNFDTVRHWAHRIPGAVYALGIHPLYAHRCAPGDLDELARQLREHRKDPKLVAVGETGLDGFVPGLDFAPQVACFKAQLKLACEFDLPVIMHVRKAQDAVLKQLRVCQPVSGIAHAFNGSLQQADAFVRLNCALGFGGALTFERALQIRRLLMQVDHNAIVMETDSPDIAPHWLYKQRNEPGELPRIAGMAAHLLGMSPTDLCRLSSQNARRVLRSSFTA